MISLKVNKRKKQKKSAKTVTNCHSDIYFIEWSRGKNGKG